eukprot:s322_g4.t1
MSQGALPLGFETKVGVDWNSRMIELFSKQCEAATVVGDLGSHDTVFATWKAAKGACAAVAGFACQPFSLLGDELGRLDSRSACLTHVLNTAYLLRIRILVLECVSAAKNNEFVKAEIARFQNLTDFECSVIDLSLQDVWPTRRQRAWWVLHSKELPHVPLQSWPVLQSLTTVDQIIPVVHRWSPHDELALTLNSDEQTGFGLHDGSYPRYLLNGKGRAPCALHAWGSQFHPCPCRCRSAKLSAERIATKGLFGLLVRSAQDDQGNSAIRHAHPNEVMGLNCFDPVLDFGEDVKMTLCAAGQLASPLQAAWVLSFVKQQLDLAMFGKTRFDSVAQLHAFRAWLVMRCQEVWPCDGSLVVDTNLRALVDFWKPFAKLSMRELMYPPRWDVQSCGLLSIAELLDYLIRETRQPDLPPVPVQTIDSHVAETPAIFDQPKCDPKGIDSSLDHAVCTVVFKSSDEVPVSFLVPAETTVNDFVRAQAKLTGDACMFVLSSAQGNVLEPTYVLRPGEHVFAEISPLKKTLVPEVVPRSAVINEGCLALGDEKVTDEECGPLLQMPSASSPDLVPFVPRNDEVCPGPLAEPVVGVLGESGLPPERLPVSLPDLVPFVPRNDEVCPGPLSGMNAGVIGESGLLPKMPCGTATDPAPLVPGDDGPEWECGRLPKMPSDQNVTHVPGEDVGPTAIDPTAPWTQLPVPCSSSSQGPLTVPAFEVGECVVPTSGVTQSESWISAAPLLGLSDTQFLALNVPMVSNPQQLWSLRHQFLHVDDRVQILQKQEPVMADDQIRFHLHDLCQRLVHATSTADVLRQPPITIEPLLTSCWSRDGGKMCKLWCQAHPEVFRSGIQVAAVFMQGHHWIPAVMIPVGPTLHIRTWDAPAHDHSSLNALWEVMGRELGFSDVLICREQRLFLTSKLCGALAIAFLHHSFLHTMLPSDPAEVSQIHMSLREHFCSSLATCEITARPWVWGAGDADDESTEREWPSEDEHFSDRATGSASVHDAAGSVGDQPWPLHDYEVDTNPRFAGRSFSHRCITAEERIQIMAFRGKQMADDEMRFHLVNLIQHSANVANQPSPSIPGFVLLEPLVFSSWEAIGPTMLMKWCQDHMEVRTRGFHIVSAIEFQEHWTPFWIAPCGDVLQVHLFEDAQPATDLIHQVLAVLLEGLQFSEWVVHQVPLGLPEHSLCGVHTLIFLAHVIVGAHLPSNVRQLADMHTELRSSFVAAVYTDACCRCPSVWGAGNQTLTKQLAAELQLHGVPEAQADSRAAQAIKAIGSEQVQNALSQKQPWRQLKHLANNVRFQFLLPNELDLLIQQNRGKPVPQILSQQIGPVVCGAVLMTASEAEPYLRAGVSVSQEPLALIVLVPPGGDVQTALPHGLVTVPCRCVLDNEPLLIEACIVQLGKGIVEKCSSPAAVAIDSLDVVALKVLVYHDEINIDWELFISSPIKHIVQNLPLLKRCYDSDCSCPAWHNLSSLPVKEPVLDVWRRQFLKSGFKPSPAAKSEFFTVCMRIPHEILLPLLEISGAQGIYTEPRTPDGRSVLEEFVVVWTPKHNVSSLMHLKQTNPGIVGLARTGERRGLRVQASQAHAIHKIVRPDAIFLPQGQRLEYVAGPFPYGVDRHAICRAMASAGWQVKALQPTAPAPGKGTMWILHAVEPPPDTILWTSQGEVVITKHRQQDLVKPSATQSVGSASTLALCGAAPIESAADVDPWTKTDPWAGFKPSTMPVTAVPQSASMAQMEQRIQDAVMSKLPHAQPMDDDLPDRLCALENQVQGLMTRQQNMEVQFTEFSGAHSKQLSQMQTQITAQTQHLHGQLENQSQSIQALFENQMSQIRGLLSKRPREEGME